MGTPRMTPDQIEAHLILAGWQPVRYARDKGDVWQGIWKESFGLVYKEAEGFLSSRMMHAVSGWPHYIPDGFRDRPDYAQTFRCRWCDVREVLPELLAEIERVGA